MSDNFGSLECPRCGSLTNRLVIPLDGKLSCRECTGPARSKFNPHLNQTNVRDHSVRVTNGKAWEIDNRIISPDDHKTVINRRTGKEAQY